MLLVSGGLQGVANLQHLVPKFFSPIPPTLPVDGADVSGVGRTSKSCQSAASHALVPFSNSAYAACRQTRCFWCREDFRELPICSVDPPGCRDIDDALHVRPLPSGNLEVGVHIADVTHFLKPGTPMDEEAASRYNPVTCIILSEFCPMM